MIKIKKLKCGIRIVMEKIDYVQSVALGIWTKTGAVNEDPEISGISHLIEHMMFKGTENRTARQIAEDVDKIGGQQNAFTGKELTCYYMKVLASNIEKAADILLDMFVCSKFDEQDMEREKKVIYEEIKMIQDTPDEDAHDTIGELVFAGTPLGKSIIGTPQSLAGISSDTIRKYIRDQYTRDCIVVSISGNFDEEEVCALFDEKLAGFSPEKETPRIKETPYVPQFKVKVKDIEQSHLCLATKTFKLDDDRYYALMMLNNIMGSTMSSRFFQNIREEKGLAYSVYSMSSSYTNDGYYNIYAGISHDKIEETIEAIRHELKILKKDGVSEEELSMAREQIKSSYIFGQENVNSRMFTMGKNILLLNRTYTPEEFIEEVDSVTMEDIENVAEIICNIDNYSGVAVTNREIPLQSYLKG